MNVRTNIAARKKDILGGNIIGGILADLDVGIDSLQVDAVASVVSSTSHGDFVGSVLAGSL